MKSSSKQQQRLQAHLARDAQINKDALSLIICQQFIKQPAYQNASTIMCYLHCRSEVRTLELVKTQLKNDKRLVIPYCTKDKNGHNKLGLWLLDDVNELVVSKWGILEPPETKWNDKLNSVKVKELDLVMVPGVAFNRHGARLGYGAGYYDSLLCQLKADCILIGLAYESQLFENIQMNSHDIYMDFVLTEKQLYARCTG